jgi:hypothetical protein
MNDDRGERWLEKSGDGSHEIGEETRPDHTTIPRSGSPLLAALELFLDVLADEVARRIDEKNGGQPDEDDGAIDQQFVLAQDPPTSGLPTVVIDEESPDSRFPTPSPVPGKSTDAVLSSALPTLAGGLAGAGSPDHDVADEAEIVGQSTWPAPPPANTAALMARLAVGILLVVALINVPYNTQGTALARSIPSSASLVIRNGLLVKESNSTQIWVYRDNAFHWITSLNAFDHYHYRWQDVQIVEPGFVTRYDQGSPIYVLLKCDASPHIYRLEDGRKRWIVDLSTFIAAGYVWQDVSIVPCYRLHDLPDGDSIPPGRGSPPPPLP